MQPSFRRSQYQVSATPTSSILSAPGRVPSGSGIPGVPVLQSYQPVQPYSSHSTPFSFSGSSRTGPGTLANHQEGTDPSQVSSRYGNQNLYAKATTSTGSSKRFVEHDEHDETILDSSHSPSRAHLSVIPNSEVYGVGMSLSRDSSGDGFIVIAVEPGSSADANQVQVGDCILSIDDLNVRHMQSVSHIVLGSKGSVIKLQLYNPSDQERTVTLVRGGLPIDVASGRRMVGVGVTLGRVKEGDISVVGLDPNGSAAHSGIKAGDILLMVDDLSIRPTHTVDTVQRLLAGPSNTVLRLHVQRSSGSHTVSLVLSVPRVRMPPSRESVPEPGTPIGLSSGEGSGANTDQQSDWKVLEPTPSTNFAVAEPRGHMKKTTTASDTLAQGDVPYVDSESSSSIAGGPSIPQLDGLVKSFASLSKRLEDLELHQRQCVAEAEEAAKEEQDRRTAELSRIEAEARRSVMEGELRREMRSIVETQDSLGEAILEMQNKFDRFTETVRLEIKMQSQRVSNDMRTMSQRITESLKQQQQSAAIASVKTENAGSMPAGDANEFDQIHGVDLAENRTRDIPAQDRVEEGEENILNTIVDEAMTSATTVSARVRLCVTAGGEALVLGASEVGAIEVVGGQVVVFAMDSNGRIAIHEGCFLDPETGMVQRAYPQLYKAVNIVPRQGLDMSPMTDPERCELIACGSALVAVPVDGMGVHDLLRVRVWDTKGGSVWACTPVNVPQARAQWLFEVIDNVMVALPHGPDLCCAVSHACIIDPFTPVLRSEAVGGSVRWGIVGTQPPYGVYVFVAVPGAVVSILLSAKDMTVDTKQIHVIQLRPKGTKPLASCLAATDATTHSMKQAIALAVGDVAILFSHDDEMRIDLTRTNVVKPVDGGPDADQSGPDANTNVEDIAGVSELGRGQRRPLRDWQVIGTRISPLAGEKTLPLPTRFSPVAVPSGVILVREDDCGLHFNDVMWMRVSDMTLHRISIAGAPTSPLPCKLQLVDESSQLPAYHTSQPGIIKLEGKLMIMPLDTDPDDGPVQGPLGRIDLFAREMQLWHYASSLETHTSYEFCTVDGFVLAAPVVGSAAPWQALSATGGGGVFVIDTA